eukprot:jgi/Chrzof1/3485/Cz12g27060.t1
MEDVVMLDAPPTKKKVTLPPVPLTDEVKQSSVTMLASDVFSKAQLMNWHEKVYGTQMGDKSKQWLAEHIVERYANDVRTLLNCQHVGKALLELYLVKHCGQNTKNLNKADMVDRVLDILQQPSRQEVDPGSGYEDAFAGADQYRVPRSFVSQYELIKVRLWELQPKPTTTPSLPKQTVLSAPVHPPPAAPGTAPATAPKQQKRKRPRDATQDQDASAQQQAASKRKQAPPPTRPGAEAPPPSATKPKQTAAAAATAVTVMPYGSQPGSVSDMLGMLPEGASCRVGGTSNWTQFVNHFAGLFMPVIHKAGLGDKQFSDLGFTYKNHLTALGDLLVLFKLWNVAFLHKTLRKQFGLDDSGTTAGGGSGAGSSAAAAAVVAQLPAAVASQLSKLQNMLTRWDELKTSMQDNALLTTGIVIENIARAEPMPIAQALERHAEAARAAAKAAKAAKEAAAAQGQATAAMTAEVERQLATVTAAVSGCSVKLEYYTKRIANIKTQLADLTGLRSSPMKGSAVHSTLLEMELQDLNDNIAKLQSDFDDVNRKLKASEKLDKEYKHTQKQLMDMLARLHLST